MHLWQEPDRASVERRFAPLAAARSPHPGRSPGFGTTAVPLVVKESRGDAIMEFGNHALEHGPPCYWLRASVSTTRHPHPQPRQFDLPLRKVDLFNDVRTPPARTRALGISRHLHRVRHRRRGWLRRLRGWRSVPEVLGRRAAPNSSGRAWKGAGDFSASTRFSAPARRRRTARGQPR